MLSWSSSVVYIINTKNFQIELRSWRRVLDTTFCQWLVTGRWFSPGTPVSSNNNWNIIVSDVKHHKSKPTTKSNRLMQLIRQLVLVTMQNNIQFKAMKIQSINKIKYQIHSLVFSFRDCARLLARPSGIQSKSLQRFGT